MKNARPYILRVKSGATFLCKLLLE